MEKTENGILTPDELFTIARICWLTCSKYHTYFQGKFPWYSTEFITHCEEEIFEAEELNRKIRFNNGLKEEQGFMCSVVHGRILQLYRDACMISGFDEVTRNQFNLQNLRQLVRSIP